MNIADLQSRALAIGDLYNTLNKSVGRPEWSVAEYMQGFIGDMGDLVKLIMAKNNFRTIPNHDEKIAHELADCLWSILVLAKKLNINLEASFLATMSNIEKKITAELE